MRACIFGLDVDIYNSIINENKFYDITNAAIKDVDQTYALYPNEKQMYLTNATSIKAVDESQIQSQFQPKYIDIASIPQGAQPNVTFDVVAVVLKVSVCEKVRTRYGTDVDICRVHVTDNSYDGVVILSIWNAKAIDAHQMFQNKSLPIIVGFTGLKATDFNGFSLSSTAETEVILYPTADKSTQLTQWCTENLDKIDETISKLIKEAPGSSGVSTLTVQEALHLKADLVLPGELIKIAAYIHPLSSQDIRTSLGCIQCGRNCGEAINNKIECTTCMKSTVAAAKIYMDFKATDGTATIQLMAHTKLAEKILGVDANTLHQMTMEERKKLLLEVTDTSPNKKINMLLTPVNPLLVEHKIVKWMLKDVLDA